MTCGRARRLLWPDTGPKAASAEIVEAREHVRRCEPCRRFFEEMRQIAERVRAAAPRPEAPVEVRDRLYKALARARTGAAAGREPRGWPRRAGVAAALMLLLVGLWTGYLGTRPRPIGAGDPVSSIVEDQLRAQSGGLSSGDSLEVAQWLAARLPFAVQVPVFPEARLQGARTLPVERRLGAVVEYTIDGRSLSYYILPAGAGNRGAASRVVRLTSHAGYHLATWEDAGLIHALVGVLPEPKLLELARYCIHQMIADLGGSARPALRSSPAG